MNISLKNFNRWSFAVWIPVLSLAFIILLARGWPYTDSAGFLWEARRSASKILSGDWMLLFTPIGMRGSFADSLLTWLALVIRNDFVLYKTSKILLLCAHAIVIKKWTQSNQLTVVWLMFSPLILMSEIELLRESFFIPLLIGAIAWRERRILSGILFFMAFVTRPVECSLFAPLLLWQERSLTRKSIGRILSVASIPIVVWIALSYHQMSHWFSMNLVTAPVVWSSFPGHAGNIWAVWGLIAGIDWLLFLITFLYRLLVKKELPRQELFIFIVMLVFMVLRTYLNNPILRYYGIPSIVLCFLIWKSFHHHLNPAAWISKSIVAFRVIVVMVVLISKTGNGALGKVVGPVKLNWHDQANAILQNLPKTEDVMSWSLVPLAPKSTSFPRLDDAQLNLAARSMKLHHRFKDHLGGSQPEGNWIAGPFPGRRIYDYLKQGDLPNTLFEKYKEGSDSKIRSFVIENNKTQTQFLFHTLK